MEWLIGKTGLDGHVRRNRLRVILLFVGFQVAAQLALLPIAAVATIFFDYKHLVLINPGGFLLRYAPFIAAGATVLFLVRWWRFPVAIGARLAAQTGTPACRRLQRLVEELSVLNGVSVPRIVMIDAPALNAFAAGMSSRDATIIVTTGLEAALTDAELKCVLAHEMAHLVFGDTRVMAASAVMVDTLEGVRAFVPWKNGLGWRTGLLFIFMPILVFIAMMVSGLSVIADTVARGTRLIVSSSRELIADAEAIRMTRDPASLVSALRKIDGRSGIGTFPRAIEAMMIDGLATGPEATHPTIRDRIATIVELTGEHFPMPAAPSPRRPLPVSRPARSTFGLGRRKEAGFVAQAIGQTAFGRVREGQGEIIKKTRAFRILAFAPVLVLIAGFYFATTSMKKLQGGAPQPQLTAGQKVDALVNAVREGTPQGVFRFESTPKKVTTVPGSKAAALPDSIAKDAPAAGR